jgi:hypothetical protein
MLVADSLVVQKPATSGRTVSSWIQKQAVRLGMAAGPMLGIGLALLGLLPLWIR